jgi:hypothetical protein
MKCRELAQELDERALAKRIRYTRMECKGWVVFGEYADPSSLYSLATDFGSWAEAFHQEYEEEWDV